ncbi:hypothetical protein KCP75_25795 [Salmonella enterica subsp. enterica]|nr:hypothetical protein KCP75_25795 [Salmonella enterica subsp. enterica]
MGENIVIRRVVSPRRRRSVLTSTVRASAFCCCAALTKSWLKQLAMHAAASKPEFVKPEDASADVVEKEYRVQLTSRCSPVSRKKRRENG